MTWLARLCALLILAMAALAVWMTLTQTFDPQPTPPSGITLPILGIELARTADEVRALFRDPMGCHNRDVFRGQIRLDWYFIAAYWALLCGLGGIAAFRPKIHWKLLAVAVFLLATAAAVFDSFENTGIVGLIDAKPEELVDINMAPKWTLAAQEVRRVSLIKWGCFFGAMIPIAMIFLFGGKGKSRMRDFAGLLFLAAGGMGIVGVFDHAWIAWASAVTFAAFLFALVVTAFVPDTL